MYNYDNTYDYATIGVLYGSGFLFKIILVMLILFVIIYIVTVVSRWKIFKKTGKHGWAALIPIYETIVLIQSAGLPIWYFALYLIPIANIYANFKVNVELAHKFGKSTGFGVVAFFFETICHLVLAFGKSQYVDNGGNSGNINVSSDNGDNMNNTVFNSALNFNNPGQFNNINTQSGNIMDFNDSSFVPSGNLSNGMIMDDNVVSSAVSNNLGGSNSGVNNDVVNVIPSMPSVNPEVNNVSNVTPNSGVNSDVVNVIPSMSSVNPEVNNVSNVILNSGDNVNNNIV